MTEITYTRQGDYNLPNLLPPQEEPVPHGKYALLRKKFLKEHRRVTYTNLLTSGKLNLSLIHIYSSALYHICEFAERLEQTHGSVIPLRSSLPVQCFSVLPSSGELILLTRGEKGYSPCPEFSAADAGENRRFAEDSNGKNGVTKAHEAAMPTGSMFGWQTPAADPKNDDEQGLVSYTHLKHREITAA